MNQIFNQNKLAIGLILVGLVLLIGGIFSSGLISGQNFSIPKKPSSFSSKSPTPSITVSKDIKIDISGAVNNPGVYNLGINSRLQDAIKAAGGFSIDANSEFISKSLNLSQKLSDGQKIYVPFVGEQGSVAGASTSSLIGINSGSSNDLDSLPGVGPATAQKIVDGRPYNSLDQLVNKKIISKTLFDKIKDKIDLN